MKRLKISVVGCGLGGAAAASLLLRHGYEVTIYEQSERFLQLGAGIHLTPNMLLALRGLSIEKTLLSQGYEPDAYVSRNAHTGHEEFRLPLQDAVKRFGGRYVTISRYEFHKALIDTIDASRIHYGKRLEAIKHDADSLRLQFTDGTCTTCDLLIGADGLFSVVRQAIHGAIAPSFSGYAAYRSVVQTATLPSAPLDDYAKWWSADRFLVAYYMTPDKNAFYFVAGFPTSFWPEGAHSLPADSNELMDTFADFHPSIRTVLASAKQPRKWPLYARAPGPVWHKGRIVMLGDACHPMKPHMAQGAAMAVEDGVILFRCLQAYGAESLNAALSLYETHRTERVAQVQTTSNDGQWLRNATDPSWVFSHDVWNTPIQTSAIAT